MSCLMSMMGTLFMLAQVGCLLEAEKRLNVHFLCDRNHFERLSNEIARIEIFTV